MLKSESLLSRIMCAGVQGICAKARKLPKQTPELKDDLEAFEAKLDADAAEVAEEDAAARAARKQVSSACHLLGLYVVAAAAGVLTGHELRLYALK